MTAHPATDRLAVAAPALDVPAAAALAEAAYGLRGTCTTLGGERDQNFRLDTAEGAYVLKVSNAADDAAVLDLQAQALAHLARQDPGLPVMRLVPTVDGAPWTVADDAGTRHLVRLFTHMPGRAVAAQALDGEALRAYGAVVARTGRALRGFFHPAARYDILWDLRHTLRLRSLLDAVGEAPRRALAARVLDRFEERVAPVFDGLRAQVVHNDLTLDNVLLDGDRVSGIVDLGDLTHTALVCDLAIALAAVTWRRADPLEAAEATIAGYGAVIPLEDVEADVLADLLAARLAAWGVIAAWRVTRHPDNAAYITAGEDDAWTLLDELETAGDERVRQRLRAAALTGAVPYTPVPTPGLARRRRAVLGAAPLSYRDPVHIVAGRGVWLFDRAGDRFLDAYNNVPVVGHAHPRVAAAVAAQTRTLATNIRYLHEAVVELAERLVATMPPGLDTVLVVNSGSEANDLAWRLATAFTGRRGALVTDWAYHGVTGASAELSPETWLPGERPGHVATVAPPGAAGPDAAAAAAAAAIAAALTALAERGHGLAAMLADPAFTSDGILGPGGAFLRGAADAVRRAGGILVVDEVQAGHGRVGSQLWSFLAAGVVPDVVTLGKAMGNGQPVAAVVTRADIAAALLEATEVFSTFGGNPVACAAALAVLDVIEQEGLLAHAAAVGAQLRAGLGGLAARQPLVADVRGQGLLVGVELADEGGSPAGAAARAVVDGLRERRVLIGSTGRHGNVLKIRPPLPFQPVHVELLLEALDDALTDVSRHRRRGGPDR
jgi:4-aminobutyrate aminotransferase-like enzyme/Ser/Thr protein kinase RdoA (MazF antagonist)